MLEQRSNIIDLAAHRAKRASAASAAAATPLPMAPMMWVPMMWVPMLAIAPWPSAQGPASGTQHAT